jgi:hypothetical protein
MTIVGPRTLAESLAQDTDGDDEFRNMVEADIREDPGLYYLEYADLCKRLGSRPFPRGMWKDLCAA